MKKIQHSKTKQFTCLIAMTSLFNLTGAPKQQPGKMTQVTQAVTQIGKDTARKAVNTARVATNTVIALGKQGAADAMRATAEIIDGSGVDGQKTPNGTAGTKGTAQKGETSQPAGGAGAAQAAPGASTGAAKPEPMKLTPELEADLDQKLSTVQSILQRTEHTITDLREALDALKPGERGVTARTDSERNLEKEREDVAGVKEQIASVKTKMQELQTELDRLQGELTKEEKDVTDAEANLSKVDEVQEAKVRATADRIKKLVEAVVNGLGAVLPPDTPSDSPK